MGEGTRTVLQITYIISLKHYRRISLYVGDKFYSCVCSLERFVFQL